MPIMTGVQEEAQGPVSQRREVNVTLDARGRLLGLTDLVGLFEENNRLLRKLIAGLEQQVGVEFPDVD